MKLWVCWSETLMRARLCGAASAGSDRFVSGRTGSFTNSTSGIALCVSWPSVTAPLPTRPTHAERFPGRELAGYLSARRGAYRVVYRLIEDDSVIHVVRIEYRADVYRRL